VRLELLAILEFLVRLELLATREFPACSAARPFLARLAVSFRLARAYGDVN
jgi:hypothetical protein